MLALGGFAGGGCSCAVGRPDYDGSVPEDTGVDSHVNIIDSGYDAGPPVDAGDPCGNGTVDTDLGELCDPNAPAGMANSLRCLCDDDSNACTSDDWTPHATGGVCQGMCVHNPRSGFGITDCMTNPDPLLACHQYAIATGTAAMCNVTCMDVTPSMEPPTDCDGVDDDCDGTPDDDYAPTLCAPGGGLQGPCNVSMSACMQNGPGSAAVVCPQTFFSSSESCNNVDDNCDGTIDNGIPVTSCLVGGGLLGRCNTGLSQCLGGVPSCQQTFYGATETCNSLDDDCNGTVDNVVSVPCTVQGVVYGICATSMSTCISGNPGCPQTEFGHAETCNALDDDCDGMINNGDPGGGGSCAYGAQGPCGAGIYHCGPANSSPFCTQVVFPTTEICAAGGGLGTGDGIDNNCDGLIDINPSVTDGVPNTCGTAGNLQVNVGVGSTTDVIGDVDANGNDYFVVNFQGLTGMNTTFHPNITISSPGNLYNFSLFTNNTCGTAITSTTGVPGSTGCVGSGPYMSWSMTYNNDQSGCSSSAADGRPATCSDNVTRNTSMVVRVQRVASGMTNCTAYTVTVKNQ